MFKLFKHEPNNTVNKNETNQEDISQGEQMKNVEQINNSTLKQELISDKEFSLGIKDAMEYVARNGKIDPETLEIMTGMKLEETLARLEKQESLNIEMNVKDVFDVIKVALDTENDNVKENWFRKMVNRPLVKAAFVTLMLFLKFAPESKADNVKTEDKASNKTEQSFQKAVDLDSDNTYTLSSNDLDKMTQKKSDAKDMFSELSNLERYSKLELSNFYDTDSDHISDENRAQIEAQMIKFLDNVNENNVQKLLDGTFEITGSSDERETSREGGNLKLTVDRIDAARQILQDVIDSYDFGDRFSEKEVKAIKNKAFESVLPEGGVTHLTDLINPDTGENYTEADIKSLSEDEKLELFKDCRKVSVDFLVENDIKINQIKPLAANIDLQKINKLEQTLSDWQNYDEIFYIVDNSPSMQKNHQAIARIILNQKDIKGTKINFGNFSDDLNKLKEVKDLNEIAQKVNDGKKIGSSEERVLKATISTLNKIKSENETSKKIIIATDENFQNLNWDELNEIQELSEEKNVEIVFIYANQESACVLDLETLKNAYEDAAWSGYEPIIKSSIESIKGKIYRAELQVKALESVIKRIANRDNVKEKAKMLVYQEKLNDNEQKLATNKIILENIKTALAEGDLDSVAKNIRESGSNYPSPKVNLNPEGAGVGISLNK